jgi:acyl carrier protein
MYGITETTVHVTFKEITWSEIETNTSNIGKPIPTLSVYLTDKYLKPVPIGVAGEIVVGGAGVGRGYLNRPELTSERFCLHPTSLKALNTLKVPGQKNQKNHRSYRSYMSYILYKSGDLGRWLPNGEMEYLGRIDQQVKIRGYRIETGEIEAVLNRHPGVSESVVAAREDIPGSKRLVAYVAARNPGEPPPAEVELRHFLQAKLPDYMIPAQFVHLDAFPLFANGKIDRRNLPAPGLAVVKAGKPAVSPRTPVEKKLTSIIADVLNLDRVSILDNFFQLGGDSLLSFRVILLAKQVGIEITTSDVFKHPTIEAMAAAARKEPAQQVEKYDSQDIYPLTPVQQQMFAYNLLTPDTVNTIQHLGWLMSGDLDIGAFKKAWQTVAQRHCILRTAFKRVRLKEPVQQLYDSVTIPWQQMDCSHMTVEEQRQAVEDYISRDKKKRFKMSEQPLMRLFLFILDNHSYRFICSYSSLLLDNWSCHIIVKEIFHLYHSYIDNRTPVLPERPRPFAGYVQWLLNHDLSAARDFWKSELEGFAAPVDLGGQRINRDSPRSGFKPAQRQIRLLPLESKALAKLAKKDRLTPGTILQGTWVMTLSYFSGQEDVLSGVLSYGRSGQFRGIESMAGLFINTVPVRTKVPADKDLITWLREFQDKQVSIRQFDYVSNQDISNWSQAALHKIQTAIYERTFVLVKPPGEEFLSGLSPNNPIKISEFENSLVMNVPLRVYAELSEEVIIRLKYDRTCFLPGAVDDMARYWEILLRHLLDTPGVLLGYLKNKTQIYPRRKS